MRGPARSAGQIVSGVAALITLIALLVGIPIALVQLAGVPERLPTLAEAGQAMIRPDESGTLFIAAVAVVGWLAWATFAVSVVREVVAHVRGRVARRLPVLGPQQRLAAVLVAAVSLLVAGPAISATAAPVPATAAPPASAVAMVDHPAAATAAVVVAADPTSRAESSDGEEYRVAKGDYLGGIADRYLGDFDRYPELARLNDLQNPNRIRPGQVIELPDSAVERGARPHATGHVIDRDPPPEQPAAPTAPADEPETGSGPADAGAEPGPAPTGAAPTTTPASPSAEASTSPATPNPTTTAAAADPTATPRTAPASPTPALAVESAPAGDQSDSGDDALDTALLVGVPLVGAGLLAALTLTTLRRRRRRQEQHRPVGRRLPEPVRPEVEKELRVVAQPIAVDRLDQALRVLGATLVDRPAEQMPDIVGAWLTGDTVNLLLTRPCPNPTAPWIGDEMTWTLPGDVELPDVDGQIAPLPTLVAVASRPGVHLLLDLERLGVVSITGHPERSGDLLRYLAAELSCNTWSDHVEVTVAGFDATETAEFIALAGDRVNAAPSVAVAIDRIRRRASQVVQSLDHLGAGDPLSGRVADIAADAWMPHVLLAHKPDPDEVAALQALDNDLAAAGRCAVAVAVVTDAEVGRWPVAIAADGRLTVEFLGLTGDDASLTAARLPRAELADLANLLTTARQGTPSAAPGPVAVADDDWPLVPPAPEPESWAEGTDAAGGLLDEPRTPVATEEREASADGVNEPEEPTSVETAAEVLSAELGAVPDITEGDDAPEPDAGAKVPAIVALPSLPLQTRRRVTSPIRRRHNDPSLDTDVRRWVDGDPASPRVAILGPVTVEAPGRVPSERVRFYAEIITYLAARGERGATTDAFDEALWPGHQVKPASRRVDVSRARRWLGQTADGEPWLPDATSDRRYRLREGYLLDWHLFRRLRSRGESRGPAGTGDLRQALGLVRGAPLAGADIAYSAVARNPYTWLPTSDIQPHHLTSGVVDTAHRLVELCLDGGDITGARWAVDQAWLADPDRTSDITWRDLLRVAAAEGNVAELEQILGDLIRVREAEVPEDLDKDTYQLLCELMPERMHAGVR
ncbi:LysM peptidoglycan-binding domain-containing protein [Micromonospora sp. NPDC049662]|uniref:LysM peptidoglycan-binding domain-containing protein n=1 Tax=Micromonospora sp. NPDC049662 TaxID=3155397 RepID=UPI003425F48D